MRAQLGHHPVSVNIGITPSKADQMNGLTAEGVGNFASHVMGTLHQVRDNDIVPYSFRSISAKKTLQRRHVI